CKELTANAPVILENECPDCKAHFDAVLRHLDAEGVPYQINHRLVRGLDYYTRTTWEVVSNEIGSQGSVAGGGRYDGLVEQLGGPAVPGIGFACGMERLALLLEGREMPEVRPDFYVAVLDDTCRDAAFGLAQTLRRAGFAGTMGYESRSMKATMRQAGKSNARFTLIIGSNELAAGTVIIKNMESGEQREVPMAEAAASLKSE
ncbi:MAG: histidine--tRNA ligase, partial [Mailhella sp.]|nr:histidine--tRNA ligase [Mailhella sp.]